MPVNQVRMIIPITVEQLFEGRMFAQPEAQTKARQMMNPTAVPGPQAAAEAAARQGELAHQVVGAVEPSQRTEEVFHKYTPAPVAGMPTFARWLSMLAVSRWGLEALADLCLHGSHSTQDYAYKIINTVSISLHPFDVAKLQEGLAAPPQAFEASGSFPLPSSFWKDKGPYLTILACYAILMIIAVLAIMKRKDAT
jgi:hypothetical protein